MQDDPHADVKSRREKDKELYDEIHASQMRVSKEVHNARSVFTRACTALRLPPLHQPYT